jgi:tetratricopeptide (TPR) repeat protein
MKPLPAFEADRFDNLTVLVVDDSFNMRATIKKMTRTLGFKDILEAGNGSKALECLSKNVVDIILCDWNMPGLKGIDVLKYVRSREETKSIPFIMVTAEMSEAIVAESAESDVDDYLVKPFSLSDLDNRIVKVLKRQEDVSEIDQLLEKGTAYVITHQFDKASEAFKKAQALNPKSPRTLHAIGRMFMKQGLDTKARELFERAVQFSPSFLKGHQSLADLHQSLGNTDEYLYHLKLAVEISPRNLERKIMLGEAYAQNGDIENSKSIFTQVLEEATAQYSEIAEKVGEALLNMGSYDVAEKAFSRALDASPENVAIFNKLGIAFRKQGKFEKAVRNYQRALTIAPNDEKLYYNLARAHMEAGDQKSTRIALEKALSIKPKFKEAKDLLAKMK